MIDSGEYDIDQFHFDDAYKDIVIRTWRRLQRAFTGYAISSDNLYYVAASATECLLHRREDRLGHLEMGGAVSALANIDATSRKDAHFYFTLVRSWAQKGRLITSKATPIYGSGSTSGRYLM